MTHLGPQLSAWIDEELSVPERERVVMHLARCDSCRSEALALRTLKSRMTALGEAAADAGLTGRLMELAGVTEAWLDGRQPLGSLPWPAEADTWQQAGRSRRTEARPSKYLVAGSFALFLASLGTAAFIAGGGSDAPAPRVTPAVDVYMLHADHPAVTGPRRRTSGHDLNSGPLSPGR
jgi:anti-sigma factor RsiW